MIDDLYAPIGKFTVRFQSLELMASALLIELLRLDYDSGLCLTAEMSFTRIVAALVSISQGRISDETLVEDIRALARRLSVCEEKRNSTLHSMFMEVGGELKRAKITAKQSKGLQKIMHDTSVKEVEAHTEEVDVTIRSLLSIAQRLQALGLVSNQFFGMVSAKKKP